VLGSPGLPMLNCHITQHRKPHALGSPYPLLEE